MSKITGGLKQEHEAIKSLLQVLDKICGELDSGENVGPEYLDKMLEFFKVFADVYHHGKEENLLFRAIENFGAPEDKAQVHVMLIDHRIEHDYVESMNKAVSDYKQDAGDASDRFVENGRSYIIPINQHIEKEDSAVYPIADECLPKEAQLKLVNKLETVERDVIGIGEHKKLHKLLYNLEEAYLP